MKIKLSSSDFCLSPRETLGLDDAVGVRIESRAGTLWVTQDHDLRDVVLRRGESHTIDRPGRAIVQALEPSQVHLSAARGTASEHAAQRAAVRLGAALRSLTGQPAWA